jgi:hypothetical protein
MGEEAMVIITVQNLPPAVVAVPQSGQKAAFFFLGPATCRSHCRRRHSLRAPLFALGILYMK